MNTLNRIHELCIEQCDDLHKRLQELGAKVEDERGHIIPQPQTEQEQIAFLAGRLASALFFRGATIYHGSTQLFVFERQGNPSQKFAIPALSEEDAQGDFQYYLDEHSLPGCCRDSGQSTWRDYWRMKIAGKVDGSVFSLSNI